MIFLLFSLPVLAAAPSDSDSLGVGLGAGWSDSDYGYPSGWGSSWFSFVFQKIRSLVSFNSSLSSGWFDSSSGYPSGFASSWFWRVLDNLRSVSSSFSSFNNGLSSGWGLSSSGGIINPSSFTSSWFSFALYELRQLENVSTGLWSGWSFSSSGVSAPSGFSGSWFYYLLYSNKDIASSLSELKSSAALSVAHESVISSILSDIKSYLLSLKDFVASPVDVALKEQTESTVSVVTDEYFIGDGGSSSSIKASNSELGDFKGIGQFIRTVQPSGVSISSLSDLFNENDDSFNLFAWFSRQNAVALNPGAYNARSRGLKSSPQIVTDYYHDNLDVIEAWGREHS